MRHKFSKKISYTDPRDLYLKISKLKASEILSVEECLPDKTDDSMCVEVVYFKMTL